MLRQEIAVLLAGIHPFELLAEEELAELSAAALDYYPRGTAILAEGGAPSEHLYVIRRGTVRMSLSGEGGREVVLDYRGEGETFGLLSVVSGDPPRASVTAEEDAIVLLIPKETLLAVLERNPVVSEKLLRSYFLGFIEKAYDETRRKYQSVSNNHRVLFATAVGELIRRRPVTARADVSIQEGSRLMVREGISSLVVVDEGDTPLGIVTDRDLREKVVAENRDSREPLRTIMATPLVQVDAAAPCSEALLEMMRHNIHHLLVVENDRFRGMVTNHDFMVLQGTSPTLLARTVSKTRDLGHLAETGVRLERAVAILSREGAKAHHVTGVITEVTERLLRQAMALIEDRLGPPPVRYALVLCGQAGRRELTLHRRLTLAIVVDGEAAEGAAGRVGAHFAELGGQLGSVLAACGIVAGEPCIPPERIRTPAGWRAHLDDWLAAPRAGGPPPGILDMTTAHGDSAAVEELRLRLLHEVAASESLLRRLAATALTHRPPLAFSRRFVVDPGGEHRQELDLYERGIRPFVDAVRVLACEHGIEARQTRERLAALRDRHGLELADEVESAMEYLQTLRIHQQLARLDHGREVDDELDPAELTRHERKTLKEAFQLAGSLQERLARRHPR
ncbi:MAG: CBS domain-containing protein [Acidobacteriota bacterium]|nr:CBS domain-containing protein [Acidobacteriota bacterium]MDH3524117.1 CBS domain-containing protein [Acidobacteriota bacterium]